MIEVCWTVAILSSLMLLYIYYQKYKRGGVSIGGLATNVVSWLLGAVLGVIISQALYEVQTTGESAEKLAKLQQNLANELATVYCNLHHSRRGVWFVPGDTLRLNTATPLQSLVLEQSIESGLFDSLTTKTMQALLNEIEFYNNKMGEARRVKEQGGLAIDTPAEDEWKHNLKHCVLQLNQSKFLMQVRIYSIFTLADLKLRPIECNNSTITIGPLPKLVDLTSEELKRLFFNVELTSGEIERLSGDQ